MENQLKHLCVTCGKPLLGNTFFKCVKCGNPCEYIIKSESPLGVKIGDLDMKAMEFKSKCCGSDVSMITITCSDECHRELVKEMLKSFGEFKKVIDQETGIAYKVPTKYIIEAGLKHNELQSFPRWSE